MAVTGIGNYSNALFQWQSQQLKSTGNSSSNTSSSTAINMLFGGTASMTSQISSMVELTKYAMDAMGVSSDARVTFSQITRYREQLQNEFNEGVKSGIAASGISDISSLGFELDKNGKITITGGSSQDRKLAQSWVDANPSFGETLLKAMPENAFETMSPVPFSISSTGKITVTNAAQDELQRILNENSDLADKARKAIEEAGLKVAYPLELKFDEDGNLTAEGEDAEALNAWLQENTELADAVKKELEKKKIDTSAVSLRLGDKGAVQISVNNAALNDIQAAMDEATDTGAKIMQGLQGLGIDKNINFALQVNADGSITVISDHPDRDKMQKFFEDNPELVKKYRQIETLAGIDDARKAMQVSPSAMRKRIQIESMAAWWAGSDNSTSYFGNYSNGNLSLLSGLNLNI